MTVFVEALDGGRRWVWRQVVRTRAGKVCARDRSARVLALAMMHVAVTLALVGAVPGWVLLLGPIVLGVPHVVADVRYLLVRGPRSLTIETTIAIGAPLAGIVMLRAIDVAGGPGHAIVELALGLAAIAIAVALAPGAKTRAWIALTAIAVPAVMWPGAAMLVLLHGHNAVGFVIWARWAQRVRYRWIVVGTIATITAIILLGALDALPRSELAASFAPVLAPGLDEAIAYRVVLAYTFLQAMHYVVWLRLIPATQGRTSTFRRSLASLRTDFGAVGFAVIAASVLAVPVLASAFEPLLVRDVYLSLTVFHAWLELAVIGYLLVSREQLSAASA